MTQVNVTGAKNENEVLFRLGKNMASIILNSPESINSLNVPMVEAITGYLEEAAKENRCKFILFCGMGQKGFCAGGDVKDLAKKALAGRHDEVNSFYQKEYAMDLRVHNFPKPVVVIADGVTMGGGLGIAAGADIVIATERTRMAMPEARIGFFPDVGATGWLFSRCPEGYPEFLGLTGYEMKGNECVRLGMATHYAGANDLPLIISLMENYEHDRRGEARSADILQMLSPYLSQDPPASREMDDWVRTYFAGKSSVKDIIDSLRDCREEKKLCADVFTGIAQRSPTALVLTLKLLRHNEGRPLADVFNAELKAAEFITRHPDYTEGVRARLIDKDDKPCWKPDNLEQVRLAGLEL